jgi:chaperonin GroEL
MQSNSEGSARRLAVARGIGEAAALIAPGFGPAGRRRASRDHDASSDQAVADGLAGGALALIEQSARDAEAGSAAGVSAGYVRDVARAQQTEAGDGTATAVILAAAMVSQAMAALDAGADPLRLTAGIEIARDAVLAELLGRATPLTTKAELAGVVSTALFIPGLGELVADAFDRVGKDGVVTVEPSGTPGLGLVVGEGMTVDGTCTALEFAAGQEPGEVILREPVVWVTGDEILDPAAVALVASQAATAGRPLVVFAAGVTADVPGGPSAGGARGGPLIVAARVSGFADQRGELLGDIAAVTGATVVSGSGDGEIIGSPGALGRARQVIVTRNRTLIIGGGGDRAAMAPRVREIRDQIKARESHAERERLAKRLAILAGGSATLEVGGAIEAATARLAGDARRALSVARLAMDHGLSTGGGAALADAARALGKLPRSVPGGRAGDEAAGARVVLDSLAAPLRRLAVNAGLPGTAIDKLARSRKDGTGFELGVGKPVPMRPRVVDAVPVITAAVSNATALAIRVLAG